MKPINLLFTIAIILAHPFSSFAYNCEDAVSGRKSVQNLGLELYENNLLFIEAIKLSYLKSPEYLVEGEDYGVLYGPSGGYILPTPYGQGKGYGFFRNRGNTYAFNNVNPDSDSNFYSASLKHFVGFSYETLAEIAYPKLLGANASFIYNQKYYIVSQLAEDVFVVTFRGKEVVRFSMGEASTRRYKRVEILFPAEDVIGADVESLIEDPFLLAAAGTLHFLIFKPIPQAAF